jgi:hypothetical protein
MIPPSTHTMSKEILEIIFIGDDEAGVFNAVYDASFLIYKVTLV